jgi:hypothetical protein
MRKIAQSGHPDLNFKRTTGDGFPGRKLKNLTPGNKTLWSATYSNFFSFFLQTGTKGD